MPRCACLAVAMFLATASPALALIPNGGAQAPAGPEATGSAAREHAQAYAMLMGKLPAAQRVRLEAAERAWRSYQQAHLNSVVAAVTAPSLAAEALEAALVRTLAERAAQLRAHHGKAPTAVHDAHDADMSQVSKAFDAVISAGGGRVELQASQDAWSAYAQAEEAFHAVYYGMRGERDPDLGAVRKRLAAQRLADLARVKAHAAPAPARGH